MKIGRRYPEVMGEQFDAGATVLHDEYDTINTNHPKAFGIVTSTCSNTLSLHAFASETTTDDSVFPHNRKRVLGDYVWWNE